LIDLHTHTTASDGSYKPRDLVKLAKEHGLQAVAVTDHDTSAGNREALEAGVDFEIEVIPGVEISADSPWGAIHIVGLFVRLNDDEMESTLRDLRRFREERNRKMIKLLVDMGIPITLEELLTEAGGDLVGRPHFAALLVKKGVVKSYQEAFDVYLKSGGKAYLDKKRLSTEDAVKMILRAGGIPILAHPCTLRQKDESQFETRLKSLIEQGVRGIEVYYTDHSKGEEAYFSDIARRYNLLISGGTDFHGAVKPSVTLGRGFGDMAIPYEILENLKEART
jgi:predicted metal-dependent phosphoesterase TrpH